LPYVTTLGQNNVAAEHQTQNDGRARQALHD
jgi:hypothetical protein